MDNEKEIFVIGGTNGVGKSTIKDNFLQKNTPYINADFIARGLKYQQSSLMLAELARQYGSQQMQEYIKKGLSFAFENNLHEDKTYKWLQQMQQTGYKINILYVAVQNINTTTDRINERVKRGEHYVPPGEVLNRYKNGITLLKHYFHFPDAVTLIDNTFDAAIQLKAEKGKISFLNNGAPDWVTDIVQSIQAGSAVTARSLSDISQVKNLYSKIRKTKEEP